MNKVEEVTIQFTEQSDPLEFPKEVPAWLSSVIKEAGFGSHELSYVFCTDTELLDMNKQFLNHDYFTDILTFDLTERKDQLEAECYISIDRVKENAIDLKNTFREELYRVMAHGLLHLLGHEDKSQEQKETMRNLENNLLSALRSTWNVAF
jgi:rRNA maturation RNase YbeY